MTGKPLLHQVDLPVVRVPAEGESLSPHAYKPDYKIDPATGCWNWLKFKLRGYGTGSFTAVGIKTGWAHRAYFEAAYGPITQAGAHVHHRCENPACVNPSHLELTSHSAHLTYHKQEDSNLSWDDVREIRRIAREGGTNIFTLAERFGVGKSQIHNIITNAKWQDPSCTPGRLVVCALEECGGEFVAHRSDQRFCCPEHRRLWNGRRTYRRRVGTPLDGPKRQEGWRDAA